MKVTKLNTMRGGWFIGNFEPSVLKTDTFEVGLMSHKKGEAWPVHYHAKANEYNVLLEGRMIIQNTELNIGDIFVIEKMEIADPVFLEDCKVLVVKVPSVPGDKIILEK